LKLTSSWKDRIWLMILFRTIRGTIETTFKTVQQYIMNSYSELKELSTTD
jgi:hypothetical protein